MNLPMSLPMNWSTNWPTWQAFFDMGGYALYVWGSVLVSWVALTWEAWALRQGRRLALQRARDAAPRHPGRAAL